MGRRALGTLNAMQAKEQAMVLETLLRRVAWAVGMVLLVPAAVWAANVNVPNMFTAGTTISAAEVNAKATTPWRNEQTT